MAFRSLRSPHPPRTMPRKPTRWLRGRVVSLDIEVVSALRVWRRICISRWSVLYACGVECGCRVEEKPELSISCGWDSHAHPRTHRPSTHMATLPARPRTTHAGYFPRSVSAIYWCYITRRCGSLFVLPQQRGALRLSPAAGAGLPQRDIM